MPVDGSVGLIEDYKLYCFAGRVELILHKQPLGSAQETYNRIYTRDWTPVNVGLEDQDDVIVEAPINGARLVQVAEYASSRLCYPFIRIDLYDTSRGIVLGEFTPGPGRAHDFNAEWDERMSTRWVEAASRLKEGIRAGNIQPLHPEPKEELMQNTSAR